MTGVVAIYFILAHLTLEKKAGAKSSVSKNSAEPQGKLQRKHSRHVIASGLLVTYYHGNPQPSFLGVITHILGVYNHHFSWFWGPRVVTKISHECPPRTSLREGLTPKKTTINLFFLGHVQGGPCHQI